MRDAMRRGALGGAALLMLAGWGCAVNAPVRGGEARPQAPASTTATAPATKAPNLEVALAWSSQTLTLPPPIDAERLVFSTPQYRRWQFQSDAGDFATTDTQGWSYHVKTAGKRQSLQVNTGSGSILARDATAAGAAGASADVLGGTGVKMIVSRLRPDGTLDNITAYRADGSIDGWIAYGPDGKKRLARVQLRAQEFAPSGAPLIQFVYLYDPDRIRQLVINDRNEAWQEVAISESGAGRGVLHEDASKADPIRRLKAGAPAAKAPAPAGGKAAGGKSKSKSKSKSKAGGGLRSAFKPEKKSGAASQ